MNERKGIEIPKESLDELNKAMEEKAKKKKQQVNLKNLKENVEKNRGRIK